jgi:hypothetical protein
MRKRQKLLKRWIPPWKGPASRGLFFDRIFQLITRFNPKGGRLLSVVCAEN